MAQLGWGAIGVGAVLAGRPYAITGRPVGAALICLGALSLASPALADQSIPVADNGTVACVASAKDLTRISLAGDQFASVSKISTGNPAPAPEPMLASVFEDSLGIEALEAHLVVLAETTGLDVLVAEGRGGIPHLPGQGRLMLDEGPDHRRRALGTKGHVAPPLVLEVVHLLADRVGSF